jgi:hypothetical protein
MEKKFSVLRPESQQELDETVCCVLQVTREIVYCCHRTVVETSDSTDAGGVAPSFSSLRRILPLSLFFRLRFLGAAMKTKQTMDVATCGALDHAIELFARMYLPA